LEGKKKLCKKGLKGMFLKHLQYEMLSSYFELFKDIFPFKRFYVTLDFFLNNFSINSKQINFNFRKSSFAFIEGRNFVIYNN